MKKPFTLYLAAFGLAAAAALAAALPSGAAPTALPVTVADLTAAGYTGVTAVAPTATRFRAPVWYFRVNESLSQSDAKKDCADCNNLVAVYAAVSESVPGWALNQKDVYRIMGARTQGRIYIRNTKTIVIVTGPAPKLVQALLESLQKKFTSS